MCGHGVVPSTANRAVPTHTKIGLPVNTTSTPTHTYLLSLSLSLYLSLSLSLSLYEKVWKASLVHCTAALLDPLRVASEANTSYTLPVGICTTSPSRVRVLCGPGGGAATGCWDTGTIDSYWCPNKSDDWAVSLSLRSQLGRNMSLL